jgi:D-alanyl-D-alanine dipeptidase
MRRRRIKLDGPVRWHAFAAAALTLALSCDQAVAQGALPVGFVYLRDVDPTIVQDIRYAGADNFIGRPLPGYGAAECILRRDVAAALKRVQMDLTGSGLALKVYDCYRPEQAVRAMASWANDGHTGNAGSRFFPRLSKSSLFARGYISAKSAHSAGIAVDLTLIAVPSAAAARFDLAASYGPCTGPAAKRSPDNSLDMGTGFDCFDVNSHTVSAAISAEQRRWRVLLVAVMAKRGFSNYHREWWHFTYANRDPASHYDFPISARPVNMPAGTARP